MARDYGGRMRTFQCFIALFSDEPQVRKPAGEPIEMDDRCNRAILAALIRLQYPFDCELDHTCAKNQSPAPPRGVSMPSTEDRRFARIGGPIRPEAGQLAHYDGAVHRICIICLQFANLGTPLCNGALPTAANRRR